MTFERFLFYFFNFILFSELSLFSLKIKSKNEIQNE